MFLFKYGEKWEGLQMYITASGTAGNPITYSSYGDPADGLPVISNIGPISAATDTSNWNRVLTNIWTLSLPSSPGRLFLDGIEYLRASTLADVGTFDSEAVLGHWFYDTATGLLYLYATQNPATLFSVFEGSKFFISVLVKKAGYMVFDNLDLRGGTGASLAIMGGSDIRVQNCRLGNAGNSGMLLFDAEVNMVRQPTSNVIIKDNIMDSHFSFLHGEGTERGCGDGVRMFWGVNNCQVFNNVFKNWAHNAIELLGDLASGAGVNNNQFYDNQISAPDIPYAHPLGADGFSGKCQNNEFFRNYISDCRTASQINGNNNWVHHNIIIGMRNSLAKLEPTAHAFILGVYGTDLVSENNRFDHNLIIDTDESAFLIRGYGFSNQVVNNSIRNNIFYENGQSPFNNAYNAGTGMVIFDTHLDGVGGNTYQNNLFYSSQPNAKFVYNQDNTVYYSAAQFNGLNGVDGNTIADNKEGDPLFTDFNNGDFFPQNSSPAVNSGIDVGLTLDYALNNRFIGPAPDIGPYETNEGLPIVLDHFTLEVVEDQKVILVWKTLLEKNAQSFRVERSTKNTQWEPIGEIPAQNNGVKTSEYQFRDDNPAPGFNYYRLNQVDWDGRFTYSKTLVAEITALRKLYIFRPDANTLQILGGENWNWDDTTVYLYDVQGKLWRSQKNNPIINLTGIPKGSYFISLRAKETMELLKFLK